MKRLLCVLLALVMVMGLVACGGDVPTAPQDEEVALAISYGIVPEEIQKDYDTPITFSQYTEMLTRVIALWDEALLPEWEDITAAAAASSEEMKREDGILEMAYALVLVGHVEPTPQVDIDPATVMDRLDTEAGDMTWDYPLFPDWEEVVFHWSGSNYMWGGLQMCHIASSRASGLSIYPFEPNGDSGYLVKPLSRADAIRAVLRFGETNATLFAAFQEFVITDEEKLELQTARTLGLIPEEWEKDLSAVAKNDEFCALMTEVIRLRYGEGEYMDAWLKNIALAAENTDELTRGGGAEIIFTAALSAKMDDYHSGAYMQTDVDGQTEGAGIEGVPYRTELFPVLTAPYHNKNWGQDYEEGFWAAAQYMWHRTSPVSHKTVMEYTPDTLDMRYDEVFTRKEAVLAALRCYESWSPREYVTVDSPEAQAYDTSIITAELLQKESNLPEVTHSKLPGEWKGMFTYTKGGTNRAMVDNFHERDVRFVAENGMNFLRAFVSFASFRYPDFPKDVSQVNLAELRDLDRLVAWAIEYDVHLSIGMNALPGYAEGVDGENQMADHDNWPDAAQWALVNEYWTMLAARYRDIPAKNLSFELCAEWAADDAALLADFSQQWGIIADNIWDISPDRVIMASHDTAADSKLAMAEALAAQGISIATHPYYPGSMYYFEIQTRAAMGFTDEPQWPMVWFPTRDFNHDNVPVRLSGDIGGTTLHIYAVNAEYFGIYGTETGDPTIYIRADGELVGSHTYSTGGADDVCTVTIPEGAQEVELSHTGFFSLFSITAEGDFGTAQVMTTDAIRATTPGQADLVLRNGVWADAENRLYDGEAFYNDALKPYVEIAEKYDVGFMVNEYTFANLPEDRLDPVPLDAYLAYYDETIGVFEKYDIGYALTFMAQLQIGVLGDACDQFSMWSEYPNYLGTQTYTYDNGFSETFPVNNTLMEVVRKYTMN